MPVNPALIMEKDLVRQLLKKYQEGTCTSHERAVVESWYLSYRDGEDESLDEAVLRHEVDQIWKQVDNHVRQSERMGNAKYGWRIAAAAAVLLVGLASIFYVYRIPGDQVRPLRMQADMAPGGNRATLTLTDGTLIELSSEQQGIVVASGALSYADGSNIPIGGLSNGASVATQHTLNIPRGGQYHVVLADGSKVWLNASSTLRYPSRFTGQSREVEIEGEAFFEIASDAMRPFLVRVGGHTVRVLGTAFNVSSYNDDPDIQITLVNGSVQLTDNKTTGSDVRLDPGEQAIVSGQHIDVKKVDVAPYIAWRDGNFKFYETELRSVLRQLSRWYDMQVEYRGDIPITYYYGQIGRNNNLSAVLRILKESGLHFSIENTETTRKLIVHP